MEPTNVFWMLAFIGFLGNWRTDSSSRLVYSYPELKNYTMLDIKETGNTRKLDTKENSRNQNKLQVYL